MFNNFKRRLTQIKIKGKLMKHKFRLLRNNQINARRLKVTRKPVQLSVVPQENELATVPQAVKERIFLNSCLELLNTILERLDKFATQARETDAQVRKLRSEHYAKYGFYFRDRF
jgi:hypothetical protein